MSYKKTQNNNEKISGVKLMNRRSHLPKRLNFFLTKKQTKILELKKSMTAIENTLENLGKEAER